MDDNKNDTCIMERNQPENNSALIVALLCKARAPFQATPEENPKINTS